MEDALGLIGHQPDAYTHEKLYSKGLGMTSLLHPHAQEQISTGVSCLHDVNSSRLGSIARHMLVMNSINHHAAYSEPRRRSWHMWMYMAGHMILRKGLALAQCAAFVQINVFKQFTNMPSGVDHGSAWIFQSSSPTPQERSWIDAAVRLFKHCSNIPWHKPAFVQGTCISLAGLSL